MPRTLTFTKAQIDAGRAVFAEALSIGENGTSGDYTDLGLLHKLLEVWDIQPIVAESPGQVGSD